MRRIKEEINGFKSPTSSPQSDTQASEWQEKNRLWWNNNPMRYDWKKPIEFKEFSRDFYKEIDKRFFSISWEFMPWKRIPFDPVIDFESLAQKDVLEIGVGNGSHAQLLAAYAKSYTGIDITDYAVKSTAKRMKAFGLNEARIIKTDAENMKFYDDSFDYIWTWGVIDHSANTETIIKEMSRVLRPGGRATVMVYHRGWWNYYFIGTVFHGILRGGLFRTGSLHKTIQENTDGAFSRYYTTADWRRMASAFFHVDTIRIYGPKTDLFPIPGSKFKSSIMKATPDTICRFLTNVCRMGGFLVSDLSSQKGEQNSIRDKQLSNKLLR